MRGSVNWQVKEIFKIVDKIGTSKHDAKLEARENGATTWHEIGKDLGIHSFATADAYRDVWRQALTYAKEEFGVKDVEKLTGTEIAGYLESKVAAGVAHSTLGQYSAALEKLEAALNLYAEQKGTGREYNFHESIKHVKSTANLERFEGSRAYAYPERLVSAVQGERYQLVTSMQLESGARISEMNHITGDQLRGIRADPISGVEKGWIEVEGKGGKGREIGMSKDTYEKVSAAIAQEGRFEFDKKGYTAEIRNAASLSGQESQGTHGLRWSWARERHSEVQKCGRTYEQALGIVSREMGHERADITEHYLR